MRTPEWNDSCLRILALLALGSNLVPAAAGAARPQPLPRTIVVEHKVEIPDSGAPELHWQLKVPLEQLVFQRRDGAYEAEIRFAVRAERRGDGHMESALWRRRIDRPDFESSRRGESFTDSYQMPLGPGNWDLEALLYVRGPNSPWLKTARVEVPEPDEGSFFLQGPRWLGAEFEISPPFRIGDPWAMNRDSAHYVDGLDRNADLECDVLFWHEPEESLSAVLSLEDRNGYLKHYARRFFSPGSGRSTLVWSLPVDELEMGPHRLRLTVSQAGARQRVEGRLDVGLTRAAFKRNWPQTLELIHPIAGAEEYQALMDAAAGERLRLWREFWQRRDPGGGLSSNEFQEIYFTRLSEVNERFGTSFRPGHLNDRGRVYLELGPPDHVETVHDDRNFSVVEYWHYTGLNRIYVFEDRHGYDDYTLVRVIY